VRPEGLGNLIKFEGPIGFRTQDISTYNVVPQLLCYRVSHNRAWDIIERTSVLV
jgi:hypothetical protein